MNRSTIVFAVILTTTASAAATEGPQQVPTAAALSPKSWLGLVLRYHPVGLRDRDDYPNLHLRMAAAGGTLPSSVIGMSRREAIAAIDALAKAGYFERASDITWRRAARTRTPWPEHKGPCYSLTVSKDNRDYHANLGWDLKMLECIDALRKALDKGSNAGKAMDRLLAALEPERKKWQAQAQVQAPAPAGGPLGQFLNHPELKKKAAERAKLLKKDIDSFKLHLTCVDENQKPTHAVTLGVRKPGQAEPGSNKVAVQVTKEQATAIIDYLE